MNDMNDLIAKDLGGKHRAVARKEYILNNLERWWVEGEEICSRREALGITATAFAKEVRLHPRRLRKLEMGKPVRNGDILRRLCTAELAHQEMRAAYEHVIRENEILRHHVQTKEPRIRPTMKKGRSVI